MMNIGSNPFGNLSSGIGSSLDGGISSGLDAAVKPRSRASSEDGTNFSDTLRDALISRPSEAQNLADRHMAAFAAGDRSIDESTLAIESAKASASIQMATRTISQAVQGIRTLMQMQI